jgi:hypothetical protein
MLASPRSSAPTRLAQLLDVDRLGEGRADHLAADEVDAEVEARAPRPAPGWRS